MHFSVLNTREFFVCVTVRRNHRFSLPYLLSSSFSLQFLSQWERNREREREREEQERERE